MPLDIVIAGPSDLAELIEVARATYFESYDALGEKPEGITRLYADRTFVREKLLPSLENDHGPSAYLIARCDGRVVGYAVIESIPVPGFLPNQDAVHFSGVYVLKSHQGRGAGRLFFEHRSALARKRGHTGAWLSVWKLNESAIQFHERMGFKIFGSQVWSFEAEGKKWVCDDWVMYRDI